VRWRLLRTGRFFEVFRTEGKMREVYCVFQACFLETLVLESMNS